MKVIPATIALIVPMVFTALAQNTSPRQTESRANSIVQKVVHPNGVTKDTSLHIYFANADGSPAKVFAENRFIVKLRDVAVSSTGRTAASARFDAVQSQHSRFLSDLSGMSASTAGRSATPKILHEYIRTFNGFAMSGDEALRKKISELEYVEAVLEDRRVQAIDLASSAVIRADDVWSDFGSTGKDIIIGIIDTGIDYTHPDLGGGFGPGYKVIGGYDFVNSDANPMDDHSHGTHVAGIAAANGPGLKGVAPDAKLFAYKVLDNYGYGWDSWIVAAIERTVDPDQNPATDDKLDVVNMSLGRMIDPLEPISQAVNNAVAAGVTFVVAAGNSYDYGTIGTPAVAADAITVAATDFFDLTAYFSSKGPVENTFALKPDVAAPGVAIYSSVLNGQYSNYDGTSMASPHVAGAAALLLEKHPAWTPQMIKGALMGTAVNTHNELIWHQGSGRVDVYEAIQAEFMFSPASISLGASEPSSSPWIQTKSLTLSNTSSSSKTFTLTASGELVNSGISITISPASLTIGANSSADVQVTFSVSTSVPFKGYPDAYSGHITATSGTESVKAPYAFLHSTIRKVSLTGEMPYNLFVVGTNPGNYYWKALIPQPEMNLMLPAGTYDFIANYTDNRYVIKENIEAEGTTPIIFDKAQADKLVHFVAKDENGDILYPDWSALGSTVISGPQRNFATIYFGPVDQIYFNSQSAYGADLKLFQPNLSAPGTFYDITLSSGIGINESKTVSNDKNSFTSFRVENPVSSVYAQEMTGFIRLAGGWSMFNNTPFSVQNPLHVRIARHNPTTNIIGTFARLKPLPAGLDWETPVWSALTDGSLNLTDFWGGLITSVPNTDEFDFRMGSTVPRLNGYMMIWENVIQFTDFPQLGYFNRFHGEREIGEMSYSFTKDGNEIQAGTLLNRGFTDYSTFYTEIEKNKYALKLHYPNYYFNGTAGVIAARFDFDTRNPDGTPPYLDELSLEVDGVSVNEIESGKNGEIKFSISDCYRCDNSYSSFQEAGLFYKKHASIDWLPLTPSSGAPNDYVASLPENLPIGDYDLMITSTDWSENKFTYEVRPAFAVTVPNLITLISPANGATDIQLNATLQWTTADSTIASFVVQVSDNPGFTNMLYDEATAARQLEVSLQMATTYYWRVRPESVSSWSDIFHFSTTVPQLDLISPAENATNVPVPVYFSWQPVPGADYYTLYVAQDYLFTSVVSEASTYDSTLVVDGLAGGMSLYWKVVAHAGSSQVASQVRSFTTSHDQIFLISPANNAIDQPAAIAFSWSATQLSVYQFQAAYDSVFINLVRDEFFYTNAAYLYGFYPGATYFWRVRSGNSGEWSQPFTFTVDTPTVNLILPSDGDLNVPNPVTFSWEPIAGADYYELYIAKDEAFSEQLQTRTTSGTDNTISLSHGHYFWKLLAWFGNTSISSETRTFVTKKKKVVLLSPSDKIGNQPLTSYFSWTSEGETAFLFELSTESTFSSLTASLATSGNFAGVSQLSPTRQYFWRVKPAIEFSDWSDTGTFFTLTPVVTLMMPVEQEVDESVTATFRWYAVADALNYTIKVSDASDFSNIVSQRLTDASAITVNSLTPGKKYYWKVGANFNGATIWSEEISFNADNILGVEGDPAKSIKVFPNPTNGSLVTISFELEKPSPVQVQVLDRLGFLITETTIGKTTKGETTWDTRDQADGMYIVMVRTDSFSVPVKVVVKH